jgi:small-conductance mechanosensitive channel
MGWLHYIPYPVSTIGTVIAFIAALLIGAIGRAIINHHAKDSGERYRERSYLTTVLLILFVIAVIALWVKQVEHRSTFLGLVGAGLAVALREPLLSIAGRIAIFAGKMYTVGDRIEINKLTGDVINVGFFYTRMMELGNWIGGDQASGRIVQFANASIFGAAVFNYTQNFSYIWDEVKLPITYASNFEQASQILRDVGGEYTREFLQGAEQQLQEMRKAYLVGNVQLEPHVYVKVTDNWIELTLRYVVDPHKRRAAQSFIYTEVFKKVQGRKDISIASSTMSVAVTEVEEESQKPESSLGGPGAKQDRGPEQKAA